MRNKISFIGVGNMATAILNGITNNATDTVALSDIILFDRNAEKMEKYAEKGAHVANELHEAIALADCIILCVKPQNLQQNQATNQRRKQAYNLYCRRNYNRNDISQCQKCAHCPCYAQHTDAYRSRSECALQNRRCL